MAMGARVLLPVLSAVLFIAAAYFPAANGQECGASLVMDGAGCPDLVEALTPEYGFGYVGEAAVYTGLAAAVNNIDLVATAVLPTDEAFKMLLDTLGLSNVTDIPQNVLCDILSYHLVANEAITSEEVPDEGGLEASTALGDNYTLVFDHTDLGLSISGASGCLLECSGNVAQEEFQLCNVTVQVIDTVLIPNTEAVRTWEVVQDYLSTVIISSPPVASPSNSPPLAPAKPPPTGPARPPLAKSPPATPPASPPPALQEPPATPQPVSPPPRRRRRSPPRRPPRRRSPPPASPPSGR